MNIPAHRAAAVAPTPAHSFELREGELVNRSEEEVKETAPADPVPIASVRRRPSAGETPATAAPAAE